MQNSDSAQSDKDLRNVIKINEAQIQDHLGEMVRSTVEETLNTMLAAARLRHIAGTQWGMKRYMNMDRLKEFKREQLVIVEGIAGQTDNIFHPMGWQARGNPSTNERPITKVRKILDTTSPEVC
jgi:hypothetical protein